MSSQRIFKFLISNLALIAIICLIPVQAEAQTKSFDIPAQPLSSALLQFSEQSHISVIAAYGDLENIHTAGISGNFSYRLALESLLQGTELVFRQGPNRTVVIVHKRTEASPTSEQPPAGELGLEEVMVTGIRLSLASARTIKRSIDAVTGVIAEEDVGKFPDANVVESLQRISGVSIARGRAGEGRFVTVRGLGQQFNLVTVNGRVLATDNIGREFSFDVLPSELISGAQIYKSPLASLVEGSIGATVNMTTGKPLERPGLHRSFSVGGLYDDLSQKWGPKLSGAVSGTFAENKMGAMLNVSYAKRYWRADMVQSLGFGFSDIDINQDGSISPDEENLQRPGYLAYPLKTGERERLGVVGAYQFQMTDNLLTGVDLLYTNYKTPEDATYQTNNFFTPDFRPGSVQIDENGTVTRFIVDDYVAEVAADPKQRMVDTWQLGWNTKWRVAEPLELSFDLAYSGARKPEGGKTKFWVAGIPNASAVFEAGDPIPSLKITLADGRDISEARNDDIRLGFMESKGEDIKDTIWSAVIAASAVVDKGVISSVDVGLRYADRTKEKLAYRNDACAYCGFPFGFADLQMEGLKPFPEVNYLDGESGYFPRSWPNLDTDAVLEIARAAEERIINPGTGLPYSDGYAEKLIPQFNPLGSSWIDEDSSSGYIQINLEGKHWRGNIGTRLASTAMRSSGYSQSIITVEPIPGTPNSRVLLSDPVAVFETNRYTNWLPSLNVAFDLQDNLLLRVAAAKTMARPSIAQLGLDIHYETNKGIARKSYNGNPMLEPIKADQLDLSLEKYIADTGLAHVALFYKDISGFVSDGASTEIVAGEEFLTTKPVNNDEAEIMGIEAGIQHIFDNGLGFQANYTYAESAVSNDYTTAFFAGQMENFSQYSYNLIGIFERFPWSARIAYSYRDEFLLTAVGQGSRPETTDSYVQLDARFSYSLSERFAVYAEGVNLTGESAHTYSEFKNRLVEYEQIATRVGLGIRVTF
jgi:iron complex outermembrane receptor protein